jgi:hypothetical protein
MIARLLTQNVSLLDRIVRLALGTALLSLTVFGPRTSWGLIGLYPFVTAVIGICPIYKALGFDSCSTGPGSVIHSC